MNDDRHDEAGKEESRPDPRNRPHDLPEEPPPRRRPRDDEEYDSRPRRRSRRDRDRDRDRDRSEPLQVSILGIFSLIVGIKSLIISFIPCFGVVGIITGAVGLLLGGIGIVIANQSGRQGKGLPISGSIVSGVAILIGAAWLLLGAALFKTADKVVENVKEQQAMQNWEIQNGSAIAVAATALDKEYDDNVVSADRKYKGKVLEVTGKVVRVAKEHSGRLTVELDAADGNSIVDCEFQESSRNQLLGLAPGQTVTIRGMCRGKFADSVTLEKCTVSLKAQTPPSSAIAVTVDDINKDYSKNPVSADAKYKGKIVEVTGKIVRVTKENLGRVTVELGGTAGGASADCSFEDSAGGQLGKLTVGKKVTIRGTFTGKIGTTTLEKCTLVK